jgi:hypothetical protein
MAWFGLIHYAFVDLQLLRILCGDLALLSIDKLRSLRFPEKWLRLRIWYCNFEDIVSIEEEVDISNNEETGMCILRLLLIF